MRSMFVIAALIGAFATQAEAASHYDLKARIDRKGVITAHLVMTLDPADLKAETGFVFSRRFKVTRLEASPGVTLTTTPTTVLHMENLQRITLAQAAQPTEPVRLVLDYTGPLRDPKDKSDVAFRKDLMELRLEDMWLPVRDNFSMVFTSDVTLSGVPDDKVVVAQGDITRSDGLVRMHRPQADFDIPITAATGLKHAPGEKVEVYARDLDNMLAKAFEEHAVKALAFEENLLGPLPGGGKVRVVVSPRQSGGAYARKNYVNSSDARDEMKDVKDFDPSRPASLVAHEFGHAWWWAADALTDNYWLAESMAEYTALRYIESAFGTEKRDEILAKKREAAKDAGPMLAGKRPTKAALYQKGPVLLFELDQKIGREKMDELMGYLGRNTPHVTGDFLKALNDIAGPDVAAEFEAKLRA
jgi:hypothetical protein